MPRRKGRARPLVSRFAEHIPRRALEKGHTRSHLSGFRGVYALFKAGKLRYVGLAEDDIEKRLLQHRRDSLKNSWDSFSVYCLTDAAAPYLHDLEAALHRISEPSKNKQRGRFVEPDDVSASIMEWHQAGGLFPLLRDGRLHDGEKLKMRWGGRDHTAYVTSDGHIDFQGKSYASPSAAGKAVANGNNVDGWAWWHYEAAPGVWHRLTALRHRVLRWAEHRPRIQS